MVKLPQHNPLPSYVAFHFNHGHIAHYDLDLNLPSLAAQVFSCSISQFTVFAAIFVATFLTETKLENLNISVFIGHLSKGLGQPPCCMWPRTLLLTWENTETFDMGIVFTVKLSFPSSLYNLNNGPIEKGLLCFFCLPVEEISAVVLTGIFIPENNSHRSDLKMHSILKLCIHIFFAWSLPQD